MTIHREPGEDCVTSIGFRLPMRGLGGAVVGALLVATLVLVPGCAQSPEPAQRTPIPRAASGKPDLNGIWQALGNAHWDIEPHLARAALAM